MSSKDSAEKTVCDIRRKTRRHRSSEEKIRVVLSGPDAPQNPATAATPQHDESRLPGGVANDVHQNANEPGAIPPGNKDQDREYW